MEGRKKKKQDNKKQKKIEKCSTESFQEDTQLNCSMDGAIRSMIGSIGKGWKKIGKDRKEIHFSDIIGEWKKRETSTREGR